MHQSLSLRMYFKLPHYLFKATIFTKHCTLSLEDHKIKWFEKVLAFTGFQIIQGNRISNKLRASG